MPSPRQLQQIKQGLAAAPSFQHYMQWVHMAALDERAAHEHRLQFQQQHAEGWPAVDVELCRHLQALECGARRACGSWGVAAGMLKLIVGRVSAAAPVTALGIGSET